MGISSLAQETMCYMGQHLVFAGAEEVAGSLTGAGFNAKQIERVCHRYCQRIEDGGNSAIDVEAYKEHGADKVDGLHYVRVDGAMYLTREDGWRESKLGRIFQPGDIVQASPKRRQLTGSTYVTHMGEHGGFVKKMDYHLENLNSLASIADGARWIWKWADRYYPESTQTVDYYHAKEHLCDFAKLYFGDGGARNAWVGRMSEMMTCRGVGPVIDEIEKLPKQRKTKGKRNGLLNYCRKNWERMQYHEYLKKGLLIGPGAIESAHRNVLQQRLKPSGQRWTKDGFQQVAQLRVVHKSGEWHRIRELCQTAA